MPTLSEPPATVLVVGAGPTGLTLATLLARYGVAVRLVEKRAELSRHTKATNLMQRSLELLDAVGLAEPLRRQGGAMEKLVLSAYGRPLPAVPMHLADSAFPDVVLCGQDAFERVAADRLAALGARIGFGTELVGLDQDDDGVTARLWRGGEVERARFAYVVGADGAAGATRRFTRLDFEPRRTGVAIHQVDCTLDWSRRQGSEQMWIFYVDRGFLAVVPLPGGVHRVLLVSPVGTLPEREPTLEELQARLSEAVGDREVRLSRLRWAGYTDLAMGLAPGLVDGRVVLAGDAGNPVLPNGGQGMNTGIADAFNLAWKLTAVLRHRAPVRLLDTYGSERHALRTALQRAQHASLRYTVLSTPAPMRMLVRALGAPMLTLGGARALGRAFSELDIRTAKSPLTVDAGPRGGVRAGGRALDAAVPQPGGTVRLRHALYDGGWTLLAFSGTGRHGDPRSALAALGSVPALPGRLITTVATTATEAAVPVVHDLDGEIHAAYGFTRPVLLLVRPDGHVGVKASPRAVDRLRDYVERWHITADLRFEPAPERVTSPVPA